MIFSNKHQFIFYAVPKTATHAMREALRPHLGANDWEQQYLFGEQSSPIESLATLRHGHISVRELQAALPSSEWQDKLAFAVVRNPLDRFVSVCAFLNRNNNDFQRNPSAWMLSALERPKFTQRILVRPQFEQLCDANRQLNQLTIIHYETINEGFNALLARLSLPRVTLNQLNESEHERYEHYYGDSELRQKVAEFYADDFSAFGYGT